MTWQTDSPSVPHSHIQIKRVLTACCRAPFARRVRRGAVVTVAWPAGPADPPARRLPPACPTPPTEERRGRTERACEGEGPSRPVSRPVCSDVQTLQKLLIHADVIDRQGFLQARFGWETPPQKISYSPPNFYWLYFYSPWAPYL